MSVIIKGMSMPETCYECRFYESEAGYPFLEFCVAHLNSIEDPRSGRLVTCPLVELPREHGDLVDRDKLMKHVVYMPFAGGNIPLVYLSYVKGARVVIPAETSEIVDWEEPEINQCRGCDDYDGRGGCKSNGGCGAERSEE